MYPFLFFPSQQSHHIQRLGGHWIGMAKNKPSLNSQNFFWLFICIYYGVKKAWLRLKRLIIMREIIFDGDGARKVDVLCLLGLGAEKIPRHENFVGTKKSKMV